MQKSGSFQITGRIHLTFDTPQVCDTAAAGGFFLSRYRSRVVIIACLIATFAVCDCNLTSLRDPPIIVRVSEDTSFTLVITLDVICTVYMIVCLDLCFCAQLFLCAW